MPVVTLTLRGAYAEVEQEAHHQESGAGDGDDDGERVGKAEERDDAHHDRGDRDGGESGAQRCVLESFVQVPRAPRHNRSSPP